MHDYSIDVFSTPGQNGEGASIVSSARYSVSSTMLARRVLVPPNSVCSGNSTHTDDRTRSTSHTNASVLLEEGSDSERTY